MDSLNEFKLMNNFSRINMQNKTFFTYIGPTLLIDWNQSLYFIIPGVFYEVIGILKGL